MGKTSLGWRKTVTLLLILCGISVLGFLSTKCIQPEKKFMSDLQRDLRRLQSARALPKEFQRLKKVQLFATSEKLEKMFRRYPIEFNPHDDGQYELEVFLDEINEGGVVVQYDLVEIASGNTVWEMGRTFPNKLTR